MKKLSTAIAIAISITIVLSMALPAFSEVTRYQTKNVINTTIVSFAEPNTIGLGQNMLLQVVVYPQPHGLLETNVTIRLTAPNGTRLYAKGVEGGPITWDTNALNKVTVKGTNDFPQLEMAFLCNIWDATGIWYLRMEFAGLDSTDAVYNPSSVNHRRPIFVQRDPVTMPPTEVKTLGFIGTNYKKIGTGDKQYIVGWVTPPREFQGGIYHKNFNFIITRPDGTTDTVSKYADSPATASFDYVCTQPGTYSAKLVFAGDDYLLFRFTACESPPVTWEVEDGYVKPTFPEEPLPTGMWKFPVSAEYQDWFQITGPWPQTGARFDASQSSWNPATKGPNSAHVLWTNTFNSPGGLIGGIEPIGGADKAFTNGDPSFVAYQGYLWYATTTQTDSTTVGSVPVSQPTVVCLDQYTGKELWRNILPGTGSVSLTLELQGRAKIDPRQEESQGVIMNLWAIGSGLRLLNPWTGDCSYYNSTFTPSMYWNHRFYQIATNSSTTGDGETYCLVWDIEDRVDVMKISLGRDYRTGYFIDYTVDPIRLVELSVSYGMWPISTKIYSWRLDTGDLLVNGTDIPNLYCTEGAPGRAMVGWGGVYYHDYSRGLFCIDTATGKLKWLSEPQSYPWGMYNAYNMARGYHLIYANAWDGYQYAYVAETGDLAWKSPYAGDSLGETAMGTYAFWGNTVVGDEKVYTATAQHTQPSPPSRGDALWCFNALTGEFIWKLDGFQAGGSQSLANGILTYQNAYNSKVYAFSAGPTETTVTAPLTTQPLGTPVLLQGTVMDMSPGAPNTPCVSDDSQNVWMQYLHNNKPKPTDAEAQGVVVHLEYIGSDGVKKDLTHVTSDLNGHYEYLWTPPAEGAYKVIATLDPTDSYYSSVGETAVGVVAAHETVEPEAAPDYTMLMYGLIAAVVVAIVIGAISLVLIMRRK